METVKLHEPWNKGKLVGEKPPLKLKDIWAIRIHLQLDKRVRDLALFNLAVDSKLRGCDLVNLRVRDIVHGNQIMTRAMIVQGKTQRPSRLHFNSLASERSYAANTYSITSSARSCSSSVRVIPSDLAVVRLMTRSNRIGCSIGRSRYSGLPDIPGLGEEFPAFEKPPAWFAFWGPAGMPQPIVVRWNAEIIKAMNSAEARAWYETNGAVVYASTPERLTQMMRESTEVYRKIVTAVGLKPE